MDSLPGVSEDSRTSEIGRKRDLAEFTVPRDRTGDFSDDAEQRSHKRARQDSAAAGYGYTPDGAILVSSSPAENPSSPSTEQHTIAPPPPMTWNKGVQSGLRTSFGSRPPTRAPAAANDGHEDNISLGSVVVTPKDDGVTAAHQTPLDSLPILNLQDTVVQKSDQTTLKRPFTSNIPDPVGKLPPVVPAVDQKANTEPKSRRALARMKKPQDLGPGTSGIAKENQPPSKLPSQAGNDHFPRWWAPNTPHIYKNALGELDFSEVYKDGQRLRLEDFDLGIFTRHFLTMNATKVADFKVKQIKKAFSTYITFYYSHVKAKLRDSVRAASGTARAQELCGSLLADAKKLAKTNRKTGKAKESPKAQSQISGSLPGKKVAALNGTGNGNDTPIVSQAPAEGVHEVPSASHSDLDNRIRDALPPASLELEREEGEMSSPADEDMDTALTDLEIELLQNYFPEVPDSMATPKCLACAGVDHTTYGCPLLTCNVCGGTHSHFTCPENQTCGKCRAKGHHATACPEKLILSRSEGAACALCQSREHLETSCHLIWRSFNPIPGLIRRVRHIPTYCYVCGANGHYGPECGLHSGKILSGGVTWCKTNNQKFVDLSSNDRAISAGVDYSLPPPKKGFSIKGMADDPIALDDSDDEADFIRPSVKLSSAKNQQGSGSHHIHFGQNQMAHQGQYTGPHESTRYGRERTFSPPPRYPDFRAGFNEPARYLPQAPVRDDYRPGASSQYSGRPAPPSGPSGRGRGAAARGGGGGNGRGKRRQRGPK